MTDIAVIGLSTFGQVLARELYKNGANVLVIDNDAEKVQAIKSDVTKAVIADASDKEVLKRLIRKNIQTVVISLGETIEISAMITLYLHQMGIKRIVTKAINFDTGKVLELIGATDIIYPEADIARQVAQQLVMPQLEEFLPIAEDHAIVELYTPEQLQGRTLIDLGLRQKYNLNLIAIKQTIPEDFIPVPSPDHKFKSSDVMVVLGERKDIDRFLKDSSKTSSG